MEKVGLRSFLFLNCLEPQLAAWFGTGGAEPALKPGVGALWVEVFPGGAIVRLMDVALKATTCRPALLEMAGPYGWLVVVDEDLGQVQAAGEAILEYLGCREEDRLPPRITTQEIIRGVEGQHCRLLNQEPRGQLVVQGESLFLLETDPAPWAALGGNEAEKAASIKLIGLKIAGDYGRLLLAGSEAEIDAAAQAALSRLAPLAGMAP